MTKTKPPGRPKAHGTHKHSTDSKNISMEKVKIKRAKRTKKKISTKEKVLAGIGLGSTLVGGVGAVSPKSSQTQFVRTQENETGSKTSKIKEKLKGIFGVQSAKASDEGLGPEISGAPTVNPWGGISVDSLQSTGGNQNISVDDSQVDYSTPGNYDVTINAYDDAGNLTTQTYTVTVPAPSTPQTVTPVEPAPAPVDVTPAPEPEPVGGTSTPAPVEPTTPQEPTAPTEPNTPAPVVTPVDPVEPVVTPDQQPAAAPIDYETWQTDNGVGAYMNSDYGFVTKTSDGRVLDGNGNDITSQVSSNPELQNLVSQLGSADHVTSISGGSSSGNATGATSGSTASAILTASQASQTTYDSSLNSQLEGISQELSNQIAAGSVQFFNGDSVTAYMLGVGDDHQVGSLRTINGQTYRNDGSTWYLIGNTGTQGTGSSTGSGSTNGSTATAGSLTPVSAGQVTYDPSLNQQINNISQDLSNQIAAGGIQFFNGDSATAYALGLGGEHNAGDTTTVNGQTYKFDGAVWYLASSGSATTPPAGSTTPPASSTAKEGDTKVENNVTYIYHNGQWTTQLSGIATPSTPLFESTVTSNGNGTYTITLDVNGSAVSLTGTVAEITQKMEQQYGTRYANDAQVFQSFAAALGTINRTGAATLNPYTGAGAQASTNEQADYWNWFLHVWFPANASQFPAGTTAEQAANLISAFAPAGPSTYLNQATAAGNAWTAYQQDVMKDWEYMMNYNRWIQMGQTGTAPTKPAGFDNRHNADGSLKVGSAGTSTAAKVTLTTGFNPDGSPTGKFTVVSSGLNTGSATTGTQGATGSVAYYGSSTPKVGDSWAITASGKPGDPVYVKVGGSVSFMGYIDGHGTLNLSGTFTSDMLSGGAASDGKWAENWYVGVDPASNTAAKPVGSVNFDLKAQTVTASTIPATAAGGYSATITPGTNGAFTVTLSNGMTFTANSAQNLIDQMSAYNTAKAEDQKVFAALVSVVDRVRTEGVIGSVVAGSSVVSNGSNSFTYSDSSGQIGVNKTASGFTITIGSLTLSRDAQGNFRSGDKVYKIDASGNLVDSNNILVATAGTMQRIQAAINGVSASGAAVLGGGGALSVTNINGNAVFGASDSPVIKITGAAKNAPVYAVGGLDGTSGGTTFLGYTDANGNLTVVTNSFGKEQVGNWTVKVVVGSSGAQESAAPLSVVGTNTSGMSQIGNTLNFTVGTQPADTVPHFTDPSKLWTYSLNSDGTTNTSQKIYFNADYFATQETAQYLAQRYGGTAKLVMSDPAKYAFGGPSTVTAEARQWWVIEFPDGTQVNAGSLARFFTGMPDNVADTYVRTAISQEQQVHANGPIGATQTTGTGSFTSTASGTGTKTTTTTKTSGGGATSSGVASVLSSITGNGSGTAGAGSGNTGSTGGTTTSGVTLVNGSVQTGSGLTTGTGNTTGSVNLQTGQQQGAGGSALSATDQVYITSLQQRINDLQVQLNRANSNSSGGSVQVTGFSQDQVNQLQNQIQSLRGQLQTYQNGSQQVQTFSRVDGLATGLQMPATSQSVQGLQMPQGYPASGGGLQMPAGYSASEGSSQVQGAQTGKTYTVKKGDTLWSIAKKFTGNGNNWRKILSANPKILSQPGNTKTLKIGAVITIPELPK